MYIKILREKEALNPALIPSKNLEEINIPRLSLEIQESSDTNQSNNQKHSWKILQN